MLDFTHIVTVYSNIYCASLRAVNPPNLLYKEYGKLVYYLACLCEYPNKSSYIFLLVLLSSSVVIPSELDTQPTSLHQHRDGGQQ
jgi:hypothetical protein